MGGREIRHQGFSHIQEMAKPLTSVKGIWLSTLPRKASKVKDMEPVPQTNTGGLVPVYQGQWVIPGQGTRQTSGRNFGIRPTSTTLFNKVVLVAANVALATVYQKHSSLQTPKGDV